MSNTDVSVNTNNQQTVNQNNPYQQYYQGYLSDPRPENVPSGSIEYAGFGIRFLAWLIDSLVLLFLSFIIGLIFGFVVAFIFTLFGLNNDLLINSIGNLLGFVVGLLYFTLFWSSKFQGTPGKILLGLKVVDANGNRINYSTAVIRYLSTILSSLLLGIGYLMIIFDDKKQALHDKLASTYVVKVKK